jgi:hypothetical protein
VEGKKRNIEAFLYHLKTEAALSGAQEKFLISATFNIRVSYSASASLSGGRFQKEK